MIKAKDSIYKITPYIGGESKSKEGQRIIKLSSNEGAFGPSPMAVKAMQEVAKDIHRYPDGSCHDLRAALAYKNNIPAENIVCGAGSDEIISLLCQAYAGDGDEVLYPEHGFLMYPIRANSVGATPVTAAVKENFKVDVRALTNAVTDKTKIIFIANPSTPTGSYLTRDEVVAFHKGLPSDVLLVLDAAYAEYVEDPEYTIGHDLVAQHDNIVVTRTFSKAYGMGGVRLGWAHGSDEVIDILNRVRGPFNVSIEAQAAGVAALKDDDFLKKSLEHNKKCREDTKQALEEIGLKVYQSVTNFLLVNFGSPENAENTRLALKDQGILIRQMGAYNLPACLRITIGTTEEMGLVVKAIKGYINNHG